MASSVLSSSKTLEGVYNVDGVPLGPFLGAISKKKIVYTFFFFSRFFCLFDFFLSIFQNKIKDCCEE